MIGYTFDFLLEPAMEAGNKDITKDVDSEKNAILKGGSDSNPKEDITKTDDIFGLKEKNGNSSDDATDNSTDTGDSETDDPGETPDDTDSQDNEDNDDADGGNDDSSSDDPGSQPGDDEDKPKSPFDLNQLRDNMILFYRIVSSNLDAIAAAINRSNDSNVILIANRVSANLESIKTVLFDNITKLLKTQPYEKSMKTYVTCRRIYDICIQMLSKYATVLNVTGKPK